MMLTVSDNTATDAVIRRIGSAQVQERLDSYGRALQEGSLPVRRRRGRHQAQIDEYHRIATDSQRARGLGLLVVAGCFVGGVYLHAEQAKVFMGTIAAVGSALSAYLNRTYLHMYGRTLSQLNRSRPVLRDRFAVRSCLA